MFFYNYVWDFIYRLILYLCMYKLVCLCIYMQTDTKTGKDLCTTFIFYTCINICKDTYTDIGRDICG